MIKRITLQNFQSHKHTVLEFTDGINALVGKTDSGKSACIRALKWVLTNRPSGDAFVNHDAFNEKGKQVLPCSVVIETDSHIVERYKFKTKNSYTVDGVELNAIGTDVPDEVLEALNLNDINIQFQMDRPFLLTESSGEVARILNRVVKLDNIDTTLRQLNIYRQRLNTTKDSLQYQVDTIKKDIEKIDIADIETTVEMAELLEEKLDSYTTNLEIFNKLWYDIRLVLDRLNETVENDHKQELVELGIRLYTEYEKLAQEQSTIDSILQQITALNEKSFTLLDINVEPIDKLVDEYSEIYTQVTSLNKVLSMLSKLHLESSYEDIDI